jgi:hypothetical protein
MKDTSLPAAGAELCVSCALVDDDDVSAEQLYASARARIGETTLA